VSSASRVRPSSTGDAYKLFLDYRPQEAAVTFACEATLDTPAIA
jgi:hypothetical protein